MSKAGMVTGQIWGFYWRYLLLMLLVLPTMALLNDQLGIIGIMVSDNRLWPTVFWGMVGMLFFLTGLAKDQGLVYFVFGKRLQCDALAWRRFHSVLMMLFLALALLGSIVHLLVNPQLWSFYKLYGQPVFLLFWPLFGACFVAVQAEKV